jgi:hypothetical protein
MVDRAAFKLRLVELAVEKAEKGYNPETDHLVTEFWTSYHREAERLAPELRLEKPGPKAAGAGFICFRRSGLPAGLTICHKLPHSCVDLQFSGWGERVHELHAHLKPRLDTDMEIVRANKSAAIRVHVPVLNTGRPFSDQSPAALQGIAAAAGLLVWATRNHAQIVSACRRGPSGV